MHRGHAAVPLLPLRHRCCPGCHLGTQDLVGLRVFLQSTREELGAVVDLFDGTGTHDVLRIHLLPRSSPAAAAAAEGVAAAEAAAEGAAQASEPKHLLLPFVKAMVPVVDLAAGRMEITPPEGLLDLAMAPTKALPRTESRGRRQRRGQRPRASGSPAGGSGSESGPGGDL